MQTILFGLIFAWLLWIMYIVNSIWNAINETNALMRKMAINLEREIDAVKTTIENGEYDIEHPERRHEFSTNPDTFEDNKKF
jgi:hypothetical protein